MGWEIATWIWRILNIGLLIFLTPILYYFIKEELRGLKEVILEEKASKCQFCQRVRLDTWECHNDRGHCLNCCYCPDHIDTIHRNNTCATAPANTWCGQCAEID